MADLAAIRKAIAAGITAATGLRADGMAHDTVTVPCAVVLPGNPYITYGVTLDGPVGGLVMGQPAIGNAVNLNLSVLVLVSDAAPAEQAQQALDAYLGVGQDVSVAVSIPDAIESDATLGGLVDFIQAQAVTQYGRIEYGGVGYFGARITVTAGGV